MLGRKAIAVLAQLSRIMAEKMEKKHFSRAGLDKRSNQNCGCDIAPTYDMRRLAPHSPAGMVTGPVSSSSSRWDSHFHSYVLTIYVRLY